LKEKETGNIEKVYSIKKGVFSRYEKLKNNYQFAVLKCNFPITLK